MQRIQAIVDTNIIGTLNKIELLGCRRFNERPNSLYYYYSVHQLPMGQSVDTFLIGTGRSVGGELHYRPLIIIEPN